MRNVIPSSADIRVQRSNSLLHAANALVENSKDSIQSATQTIESTRVRVARSERSIRESDYIIDKLFATSGRKDTQDAS